MVKEKDHIDNLSRDNGTLLLGKLAIKYQFITPAQLADALAILEAKIAGQKTYLGEILVNENMITPAQLDVLLHVQKAYESRQRDIRFGILAIKNKFATREQIDSALQEQNRLFKKNRRIQRIGDILVASNILSGHQRDAILARQNRLRKDAGDALEPPGFGPRTAETADQKASDDPCVTLSVSADKCLATLRISGENKKSVTMADIKQVLQTRNITHGIVEDNRIAAYLASSAPENETLQIAKGITPVPPRDATITYHFDTDPLKVGTLKKGGAIDFKSKGRYSLVTEKSVLAEKIPAVAGVPGKDITGETIAVPEPRDVTLQFGKGAGLSSDKLKIIALCDGIPEISATGKVRVSPELEITGDIGLETGHTDFEGKINVAGTIQNGYRVRGNSLRAGEIRRAEVIMTGDIVVNGGVIGATIKTDGNVQARYIHDAAIEALGDVVVEKEIIDSRIQIGGACILNSGHILSSRIAAKKGVIANDIGSEMSKSCAFVIGVDENVKQKISDLKTAINQRNDETRALEDRLNPLKASHDELEKKIGIKVQRMDRASVEQRTCQKKIESLARAADDDEAAGLHRRLELLATALARDEQELEALFNEQDRLSGLVLDIRKKLGKIGAEIDELNGEMSGVIEWSGREKGIPEVRVKGTLHAGTAITGINAFVSVKQDMHGVIVRETGPPEDGGREKGTAGKEAPKQRMTILPL
jgi:hypothetical protein